MGAAGRSSQDAQWELEKLRKENAGFRRLLGLDQMGEGVSTEVAHEESSLFSEPILLPAAANNSPPEKKIELFRTLFKGRKEGMMSMPVSGWTSGREGGDTPLLAKVRYMPGKEEAGNFSLLSLR